MQDQLDYTARSSCALSPANPSSWHLLKNIKHSFHSLSYLMFSYNNQKIETATMQSFVRGQLLKQVIGEEKGKWGSVGEKRTAGFLKLIFCSNYINKSTTATFTKYFALKRNKPSFVTSSGLHQFFWLPVHRV